MAFELPPGWRVTNARPGGLRRPCGPLEIAGLLEGHEVFGRQLFPFFEALEDLLRLSLRVDLFRGGLGDPAALHPYPVDDLVVVVDLPDVLDVLPVLLVREHLRLDELLLGPVRLFPQGVALLV